MTWKNVSKITHEAWIKLVILCKKNIDEYSLRDGIMEKATKNITVS
jgi:hypothetical protein